MRTGLPLCRLRTQVTEHGRGGGGSTGVGMAVGRSRASVPPGCVVDRISVSPNEYTDALTPGVALFGDGPIRR